MANPMSAKVAPQRLRTHILHTHDAYDSFILVAADVDVPSQRWSGAKSMPHRVSQREMLHHGSVLESSAYSMRGAHSKRRAAGSVTKASPSPTLPPATLKPENNILPQDCNQEGSRDLEQVRVGCGECASRGEDMFDDRPPPTS